jgi:hypothetical protein
MKRKIKKRAKAARLTPLGCLRAQVIEEPLSAEDHPEDLRLELEKSLDCARKTLVNFGQHPAVVVLYSSEKKMLLQLDLRDDNTKLIAKAALKALVDQLRATAALFISEAWIRPAGSISKEDPSTEEAIVIFGKNRTEHFIAVQRFHRLTNGQPFFEKAETIRLDQTSEYEDTWLGNLVF